MLCNDRHVPGSLGERVDDVMEEITRQETSRVKRGRDLGEEVDSAFSRVVTEAGAVIQRDVVAHYDEPSTGERLVDAFVKREHSGAWIYTDAEIDAIAARTRVELPVLLGSLDEPFVFEHELELVTARLP
jgi:hypothetical protein